jgi:hypothetical protein
MTSVPPFLSPETTRFTAIPDELQDAFFPAKLCLFEWTDYWFSWPGATHLRVGPRRVEPFAPNLFRVRFENALGASELQPFRGGEAIDAPLFVEVLSPKFPTPQAHLCFFRNLLDDVFVRAAPLPFDFEGDTSRGVESSISAPSPFWTRLFLEQNGAALEGALRHFLARPSHEWETERVWLGADRAARCDSDSLQETARHGALWRRENNTLRPLEMAQTRVWEQTDTLENRFVAAFARQLRKAMGELESGSYPALRGLCTAVGARFPQWSGEVEVLSPALERRSVSRDLVQLWRLWRGAGAPLFERFERAARLRDVASLYEFWVFFALCEEIGAVFGHKPRLVVGVDEKRGLLPLSKAHFKTGTLVFNGPAPSYSTPLRPDFLWLENGAAALAFDAKFRLELGEGEGEMSWRGADLHKMHAYRDALGVRGAVALYPGNKNVFFDPKSGQKMEFSLRKLLDGEVEGVGLWAKRP